jgi:NtrC-family two-component system response regulator AlgB
LNVIPILIPPLRERPEDIGPLSERLLAFFAHANHRTVLGFTDEARNALRRYPWPGNIRELSNAIERAVILSRGNLIGLENLTVIAPPTDPIPKLGDCVTLAALEEAHIRRVLASSKSLQETADILGIDQATLWRRRKQYGL